MSTKNISSEEEKNNFFGITLKNQNEDIVEMSEQIKTEGKEALLWAIRRKLGRNNGKLTKEEPKKEEEIKNNELIEPQVEPVVVDNVKQHEEKNNEIIKEEKQEEQKIIKEEILIPQKEQEKEDLKIENKLPIISAKEDIKIESKVETKEQNEIKEIPKKDEEKKVEIKKEEIIKPKEEEKKEVIVETVKKEENKSSEIVKPKEVEVKEEKTEEEDVFKPVQQQTKSRQVESSAVLVTPQDDHVTTESSSQQLHEEEKASELSSTSLTSTESKEKPTKLQQHQQSKGSVGFFTSTKNYMLAIYHDRQGNKYERKREFDKAIESFKKALEYMDSTNGTVDEKSIICVNIIGCLEKKYFEKVDNQRQELFKKKLEKSPNQLVSPITNTEFSHTTGTSRPSIIRPHMDVELLEVNKKQQTEISNTSSTISNTSSNLQNENSWQESEIERETSKEQKELLIEIFKNYNNLFLMHDECAMGYFQFGLFLERKGNYRMAAKYLEKSINLEYSPIEDSYNHLGICYYSIGELDKAIRMYKQAIRHDLKNASFYSNLGEAYYEKGLVNEALGMFSQAYYLNSQFGTLYAYLGMYYYQHGKQIEKALRMFQTALELSPYSSDVYLYISRFYHDENNLNLSKEYLEKALMLVPPNRQLCYWQGQLNEKYGVFFDAKKLYEMAHEFAPTVTLYQEAINRMKERLE
ncbi:hypothetical protein ABK040_013880 [Willaertia magna]